MTETDDSWLDLKPTHPNPGELVRAALNDAASPPEPNHVVPYAVPIATETLVKALRALRWQQRVYLRCLAESQWSGTRALRKYNDKTFSRMNASTVWHWQQKPAYARALGMLRQVELGLSGLDPVGVMLATKNVLDDALTPKDILDREGNPTGHQEINGSVAMRAVEFLGKVNRMTNDEAGTRVTLEIVNIATRDPVDVVSTQ